MLRRSEIAVQLQRYPALQSCAGNLAPLLSLDTIVSLIAGLSPMLRPGVRVPITAAVIHILSNCSTGRMRCLGGTVVARGPPIADPCCIIKGLKMFIFH